jgi:hypothetical protein
MSKPVKMRFRLKKAGGVEEILEVTQIVRVSDPEGLMTSAINFDRLKDGTWRFYYSDFFLKGKDDFVSIEVIP